jgi:hypothetical protein
MARLKAEMTNLPGAGAAQKQDLEARFLGSLCSQLGGPPAALAAYEEWIAAKEAEGVPEVSQVTGLVRWESAHARASWAALEQWPASEHAFFIVHISR